jgi:hypothetical protein
MYLSIHRYRFHNHITKVIILCCLKKRLGWASVFTIPPPRVREIYYCSVPATLSNHVWQNLKRNMIFYFWYYLAGPSLRWYTNRYRNETALLNRFNSLSRVTYTLSLLLDFFQLLCAHIFFAFKQGLTFNPKTLNPSFVFWTSKTERHQ